MRELNHKEGWTPKNWCFWTVVLEKTLERPLDCKEIKPVHPKGNHPWLFIRKTDAKAEAPIFWPTWCNSQVIGKDPDVGKVWGHEEKGVTQDEMVGWQHWFNGQEFEQAPGDSEGQGSLGCCSAWGRKELDMTEWLNNSNSRQDELINLLQCVNFDSNSSKSTVNCFESIKEVCTQTEH